MFSVFGLIPVKIFCYPNLMALFFNALVAFSLCTVAAGDIGVKAYSVGGDVTSAQLLTRESLAGCQEYRRVVCEPEGTVSGSVEGDFFSLTSTFAQQSHCPLITNSTCWNQTVPLSATYQLIHEYESTKWILQLKWKIPPMHAGCYVTQYHVLIYPASENNLSDELSSCALMAAYQVDPRARVAGTFSNDTNRSYFRRNFGSSPNNQFYIKIVGYPSLEYPLLSITLPRHCNSDGFPGCQNCQNNPCQPNKTPPNININSAIDNLAIKVNISLLVSEPSDVIEYFLHVKSSSGKQLYRLENTARYVLLSNLPHDNNETFIWLEQFTCGCSNTTPTYQIIVSNGSVFINQVNPETLDYSPVTSIASSVTTSSVPLQPSTSSVPLQSSTSNFPLQSSTNSISLPHSTSSFQVTSSSSFGTPSANHSESHLSLYISLPLVVIIVLLIVVVIITFLFLIIINKYHRKTKCNDQVISDLPPVITTDDSSSGINLEYMTKLASVKVIAIIPHDTQQEDKEAYLAFLDDLTLQGAELQVYCRSNRTTPADWLQSIFTNESIVLAIVNKQFYYEWNEETIADVPIVFAFKQLVYSLTQQSKGLQNFALVLPRPSDKDSIPSHYLFHTIQKFALEDTEGMSRFVFKVPEFTVDSSTC